MVKTAIYNPSGLENYQYKLPECYIYLYHTDEYFILPQYPESIDDSLTSTFSQTSALARTAPVFAYSNSGPRSVTITLDLHRDMLNNVNKSGSNVQINTEDDIITSIGDDYVDLLIKKLQAIALPRYSDSNREIDPPRVAIRFGDEIFVKGVVNGTVRLNYKLPLIVNDYGQKKYAQVSISFTVSETTPYDAESVGRLGSFRGLTSGLKTKMGMEGA